MRPRKVHAALSAPCVCTAGRTGNDIIVAFFPMPTCPTLDPHSQVLGMAHMDTKRLGVEGGGGFRGVQDLYSVYMCLRERICGKMCLWGIVTKNRTSGNLLNCSSWEV